MCAVASVVRVAQRAASSGVRSGRSDHPCGVHRTDGTSSTDIEPSFCVCDPDVVNALAEACENLGLRYGLGLTYTVGYFYIGRGRLSSEDGESYWPSFAEKTSPTCDRAGSEYRNGNRGAVRRGLPARHCAWARVLSSSPTAERPWGDKRGEANACKAACAASGYCSRARTREDPRLRVR